MIHVYPENEETIHIEATDCHCDPELEFDDETTVFHNPLTQKGNGGDTIVIELT